jgi:PKD repeat protein
MGGEITWKLISNDSIVVTLIKYRDCNGTTMSPATIRVICSTTGANIGSYNFYASEPIDITPGSATHISNCKPNSYKDNRCSNKNSVFPFGVEMYVYRGIIVLPSSTTSCKLTISHQDFSRNTTISTGAAGYPFYIEAKLNRCLNYKDNSPVFHNPPVTILCVNQPFVYNIGAVDLDTNSSGQTLDSLIYEFAPPLGSANEPTPWLSPFSYNKPVSFKGWPNESLPFSSAGLGFHLDRFNGDLMFTPTTLQHTVISILVKEYRNNSLIGEIRRDIQISIINCSNNSPPSLLGPFYKEVCAGDTVVFEIKTHDVNNNDTLKISWDSAIKKATWRTNNCQVKKPTATFTWIPDQSDVKETPYNFTVSVCDDAIPINASHIRSYQVKVLSSPDADITVKNQFCSQYSLFASSKSDTNLAFQWHINKQSFTGPGPHNLQLFGPIFYKYDLLLQLDNGSKNCSKVIHGEIYAEKRLYCELGHNRIVCYGDTINIIPAIYNNMGKVKYFWNNSSNDSAAQLNFKVLSDTLIRLSVFDTFNCRFDDSLYVTCRKPLQSQLKDTFYRCYGQNTIIIPYKYNSAINNDYFWYNSQKKLLSEDTFLTVSANGKYIIRIRDQYNCVQEDSFIVSENPQINIFSRKMEICDEEIALLEYANPSQFISFGWYLDSNYLGNTQKIYVKPDSESIYKLILKQELNDITCHDTANIIVDVLNHSEIKFTSIPQLCENAAPILLDTCVTADTKGRWYSNSSGIINEVIFIPKLAGPGSHTLFFESSEEVNLKKCTKIDSVQIKINKIPEVDAGSDDSVCFDQGLKILNALPPGGTWKGMGVLYQDSKWYFDPGIDTLFDHTLYHLNYSFTDNNGCNNSDTVKYIIIRNEKQTLLLDTTVCYYSDAIDLNSYSSGLWSGPGVILNKFYPDIANVGFNKLLCVINNQKCKEYFDAKITVRPKSFVNATNDTTLCSNQGLIKLTGYPENGIWIGLNIVNKIFYNTSNSSDNEKSDTVYYRITDEKGCFSYDNMIITLKPSARLKIISLQDSLLCFSDKYLLFKAEIQIPGKLNWSNVTKGSDGTFIYGKEDSIVYFKPGLNDLKNKYFTIKLDAVFKELECPNNTDSVITWFFPYPKVDFDVNPAEGCIPLKASFTNKTVISDDSIIKYNWFYGDNKNTIEFNPDHTYNTNGNFSVKLTSITSHGCIAELVKENLISANITTRANFIPEPGTTIISVPTIKFNNKSSPLTDNMLFSWNFGDLYQHNGGVSNEANPVYKYSDTGQYEVELIVKNQFGCSDTISKQIYILDDIQIFIPNAFTPDSKGPQENELFKIKGNAIDKFNITIYDLSGNMVYSSDHFQTHGWNGLFMNSGTPLPMDVYAYILNVTSFNQQEYKFTGLIHLIR